MGSLGQCSRGSFLPRSRPHLSLFPHTSRRPHATQLYQHVPETRWPIVYSPRYNITFMGLEKLHPFDAGKWGKVISFLKGRQPPPLLPAAHPPTPSLPSLPSLPSIPSIRSSYHSFQLQTAFCTSCLFKDLPNTDSSSWSDPACHYFWLCHCGQKF